MLASIESVMPKAAARNTKSKLSPRCSCVFNRSSAKRSRSAGGRFANRLSRYRPLRELRRLSERPSSVSKLDVRIRDAERAGTPAERLRAFRQNPDQGSGRCARRCRASLSQTKRKAPLADGIGACERAADKACGQGAELIREPQRLSFRNAGLNGGVQTFRRTARESVDSGRIAARAAPPPARRTTACTRPTRGSRAAIIDRR